MSQLKSIRLRIASIKNTQQITKAMKMVSASKLRRSQQSIESLRPLVLSLRNTLLHLSEAQVEAESVFFQEQSSKTARVIVLTTDKGLCGALNHNVLKVAKKLVGQDLPASGSEVQLVLFGKKAVEYFNNQNYVVDKQFSDMKEHVMKEQLVNYIREALTDYKAGKFGSLYIVFNEFQSLMRQTATVLRVVPFSIDQADTQTDKQQEYNQYFFEPEAELILDELAISYVESQTFSALLDNIASEHAARMTAMDSASKNAGDLLSSLQLQYNRARQATITKELIEIISGAESLQ